MDEGTEQCQRDAGGGGGGRAPHLISCFLLHQQDFFQHVTAKVNPLLTMFLLCSQRKVEKTEARTNAWGNEPLATRGPRLKIPLPSQRDFDMTTELTSFDKLRVGYRYFYASLFSSYHIKCFLMRVFVTCAPSAQQCFRKLKSIRHLEDLLFLTLNQGFLVLFSFFLISLLILHSVHQDIFQSRNFTCESCNLVFNVFWDLAHRQF